MAEFIDPAIVPKVTLPSGEEVPCMGMGTFGSDRVSAEDVSAAVAGALRSGYRMFDCAACYGNEHQIGEVFKAAIDEGVVERKDHVSYVFSAIMWICTSSTGHSRTIMHHSVM